MLTVARVALIAAAAFLLLSMGGGIIAAPVTLPLLYVSARSSGSGLYRATAAVVAGLTAAEVAWAITYLTAGETQPAIWLVPLVAAAGLFALCSRGRKHDSAVA